METIRLEQHDTVATVVLNRPEVHNAFNATMISEMTQVFANLAQNDGVRVVVLAGEGKSFSAGGDLNWMKQSISYTESQNKEDATNMARMFNTIDTCPKPVIAKIHGAALGGGCGLTSCADIAVASESALFGLTEVRLGIIPAAISPYVLQKIGLSNARRFFMTSERFDAHTAKNIGLVHIVTSPGKLDETVQMEVEKMMVGGPKAHGETKSLIRAVANHDPLDVLEETANRIARVRIGDEAQEGMNAFFEKRKPNWIEEK